MTDNDSGLVLHVPFSDALGAGPIDRSAKRHEVRVVGRPLLVADPTLGAAHRFAAGDHVQVNGLDLGTSAFTASLWARREAAEERVQLLALGATGQGQLNLYLWPEGIPELYLEYPGGGAATQLFDSLLPRGDWAHLALTFDGETLKLWQDGRPLSPDVSVPGFELRTRMLTLSSPSEVAGPPFLGSLAQLRLHDTTLEGEAIRARHAADRGLRASYLDSHPILLSLLDANDAAALYITDHPAGEPLTLEFANVAGRPVRLRPLFDDLGPKNCHFELRFRPGTLAKSAITAGQQPLALAGADDWTMSAPDIRPDGTIAFYLGHRSEGDQPVTIAADARIRLELTNARADPAGGARNARIELRYGQLGLGDDTTMLHGSRISHVSILSHIGRHNLPLHVGFIGPNTILPGAGVEGNEIRLRLTNTSPDLPIIWAPGNPAHGPASYLELTFDYEAPGEEKDWALCTLDESGTIVVEATERTTLESLLLGQLVGSAQAVDTVNGVLDAWTIEPRPTRRLRDGQPVVCRAPDGRETEVRIMAVAGLRADGLVFDRPPPGGDGDRVFVKTPAWQATRSSGTAPHWKIWSNEATHLVAGDHIDLTIGGIGSGIVTTLPPGPANLYLRYRNIPGYQGGELTAVVEKSNVVVRDGKMGIGTNKPEAPLQIGEDERVTIVGPGIVEMREPTGEGTAQASLLAQALAMTSTEDRYALAQLEYGGLLVNGAPGESARVGATEMKVGDRHRQAKLSPDGLSLTDADEAPFPSATLESYKLLFRASKEPAPFRGAEFTDNAELNSYGQPLQLQRFGGQPVSIGGAGAVAPGEGTLGINVAEPLAALDIGGTVILRQNQQPTNRQIDAVMRQLDIGDMYIVGPDFEPLGDDDPNHAHLMVHVKQRRRDSPRDYTVTYRIELEYHNFRMLR